VNLTVPWAVFGNWNPTLWKRVVGWNRDGILGVSKSILFHHLFPFWAIHDTVHDTLEQHYLTKGLGLKAKVVAQGSRPNLGVE